VTGETLQVAKSPPKSHKNALKSAHFVLSVFPSPAVVQKVAATFVKDAEGKSETLFMAIPKRLLRRAVDRNAVKRICREAWRLKNAESVVNADKCRQGQVKPKLVKLVSLPTFESTKQLKFLMRADVDALFAKLKRIDEVSEKK
jgi:ribonuclease P protein component